MFTYFKLNRKIKRAMKKTAKEFENRLPAISMHFFYGSVEIDPRNLAIWYLFKTNAELKEAENSGLCTEIIEATTKKLLSEGYPKEAFTEKITPYEDNLIVIENGDSFSDESITMEQAPKEFKNFMKNIHTKKVYINFTTEEDIDEKADGDFHLYFQ